jgi:hypothetical protein
VPVTDIVLSDALIFGCQGFQTTIIATTTRTSRIVITQRPPGSLGDLLLGWGKAG